MSKKAIVWIRDDLRTKDNPALSFATKNHEVVSALYIYNQDEFDNKREAQKWWVAKSLENFKNDLLKYNINLEILIGKEIDIISNIIEIYDTNKMVFVKGGEFTFGSNNGIEREKPERQVIIQSF